MTLNFNNKRLSRTTIYPTILTRSTPVFLLVVCFAWPGLFGLENRSRIYAQEAIFEVGWLLPVSLLSMVSLGLNYFDLLQILGRLNALLVLAEEGIIALLPYGTVCAFSDLDIHCHAALVFIGFSNGLVFLIISCPIVRQNKLLID